MSKGETDLGEILRDEFPLRVILPQHHIRYKLRNLYLDYYIPSLRMAFEVDGRQHSEFVRHYHKNELQFERGVRNDEIKDEWCRLNSITLIRFNHTEEVSVQTLRRKLKDSASL